jgi:hypothetical protein
VREQHIAPFAGAGVGLPHLLGQPAEVDAGQFDGALAVVVAEVVFDFARLGALQDDGAVPTPMQAAGNSKRGQVLNIYI